MTRPNKSGGRLTARLIPSAMSALEATAANLKISKTDVLNRALQVYGWLEYERALGNGIYIRRGDDLQEMTWSTPTSPAARTPRPATTDSEEQR